MALKTRKKLPMVSLRHIGIVAKAPHAFAVRARPPPRAFFRDLITADNHAAQQQVFSAAKREPHAAAGPLGGNSPTGRFCRVLLGT